MKVTRAQHPALRHGAWLGVVLGMLLLPLSLTLVPRWQLPIGLLAERSVSPTIGGEMDALDIAPAPRMPVPIQWMGKTPREVPESVSGQVANDSPAATDAEAQTS